MAKGRPVDPKRATRKTGNRPLPNEAKKARPVSPLPVKVESFPPPATLAPEVHSVWRAVIEDLGGANHMRESFVPQIQAYCEAVAVHAAASANIQQFGVLVKGVNGVPVANPLLRVQKDASATILRYSESLGLTPASRIRLGLMEITGMSLLSTLSSSLDGKK